MTDAAQPDKDIENADWLRGRSWDIWPATANGLLSALGVARLDAQSQRAAVAAFLLLPAARAMPGDVRQELIERGLIVA